MLRAVPAEECLGKYGFGASLPFTDEDGSYKAGYRRKLTFGEINGGLNYVADEAAKQVWGAGTPIGRPRCTASAR